MASETPTLRQAVASDAAAVRALVRAAYAKWVPLIGREPKPMGADYAAAVARHRVDLAYLGGATGLWPNPPLHQQAIRGERPALSRSRLPDRP